jgi:hypothetical protein
MAAPTKPSTPTGHPPAKTVVNPPSPAWGHPGVGPGKPTTPHPQPYSPPPTRKGK